MFFLFYAKWTIIQFTVTRELFGYYSFKLLVLLNLIHFLSDKKIFYGVVI